MVVIYLQNLVTFLKKAVQSLNDPVQVDVKHLKIMQVSELLRKK